VRTGRKIAGYNSQKAENIRNRGREKRQTKDTKQSYRTDPQTDSVISDKNKKQVREGEERKRRGKMKIILQTEGREGKKEEANEERKTGTIDWRLETD
jgi:hypothetical protein